MTDAAVTLSLSEAGLDDADVVQASEALGREIAAAYGPRAERPLAVLARDRDGRIVGGLAGGAHWRWCYIRVLWVAAPLRRAGLGRRLLAAAEAEALRRGCIGLYLDTFSADAVAFYERSGFERVGAIPDFPPGHARTVLSRRIALTDAGGGGP